MNKRSPQFPLLQESGLFETKLVSKSGLLGGVIVVAHIIILRGFNNQLEAIVIEKE